MNKYIAIKVEGINHWFWFLSEKVTRKDGHFSGKDGWGKGGAYTNLEIKESFIVGELLSEDLQYA